MVASVFHISVYLWNLLETQRTELCMSLQLCVILQLPANLLPLCSLVPKWPFPLLPEIVFLCATSRSPRETGGRVVLFCLVSYAKGLSPTWYSLLSRAYRSELSDKGQADSPGRLACETRGGRNWRHQ